MKLVELGGLGDEDVVWLASSIIMSVPTGSVKVECSPPERNKVVSSSHSRVIPKT